VRAIADGDYRLAYLIARGPNPLASLCGRVCGAHCETNCRRGNIDTPVSIRALKRFAIENGRAPQSGDREDFEPFQPDRDCDGVDDVRHLLKHLNSLDFPTPTGERVAIIGSGPAGLSCAHDLCLLGYRPVIFEMEDMAAGMLHVGVPEYRLPRDLINEEVGLIEALGTEIRCGVEVGEDVSFPDLLDEFKIVVIAVGAKKSRLLPIPGVDGPGVQGGVEFLREVAYDNQPEVGKRVLVIGGGNVAYDAARSSIRQTSLDVSRTAERVGNVEEVYLACLESREEMPADDVEIHEGEEEGVIRKIILGPLQVLSDDDGKVTGVVFIRWL
jgi:formate dehydrogenase beta subunit